MSYKSKLNNLCILQQFLERILFSTVRSQMKKKSLDQNFEYDNFNKQLFDKSMSMVGKCKKIPISVIANSSSEYKAEKVKQKYCQLQAKLSNIFKTLGKFVQAQKPTFGNALDFGVQIFQETKVLIETQIKKNQQEANTVRRANKITKTKHQRPQQVYQNIRPFENFERHSHRNYFQQGRIPPLYPFRGKIPENFVSLKNSQNEAKYVDTIQKLEQCINQLSQSKQVAVDVEHSNKSYEGMTCLIQISNRFNDYLIDVFPIWSYVPKLNKILGNPQIIKVMHGADMDTKWLQRDFNLHIVNLFDTHKASRILGMAKFSYAFLLQYYCRVDTDKTYQRADWRMRPLSPEMLLYARMDTHYLLPIYDLMRTDLEKQSRQMNLDIVGVFKQIQKSSHQVTLNEAQLFTYKNRQIYQNLEEQFKNKNCNYFKAIDRVFWAINQISMNHDENFDEMVSKKSLIEAISYIKDLIYNKKSKVTKKMRVDRVLSALKNNNGPYIPQIINLIRPQLQKIFLSKHETTDHLHQMQHEQVVDKIHKNQQAIDRAKYDINKLSHSRKTQENDEQYIRCKLLQVSISEYKPRILTPLINNNRVPLKFGNFMGFLSNKYNIPVKKQQQSNLENELADQNSVNEESDNSELQEQPNIAKQSQIIEFKRINPNVMYVLEEDDEKSQQEINNALKNRNPRKKRKQYDYEKRLKNKDGNIYQLLQ